MLAPRGVRALGSAPAAVWTETEPLTFSPWLFLGDNLDQCSNDLLTKPTSEEMVDPQQKALLSIEIITYIFIEIKKGLVPPLPT